MSKSAILLVIRNKTKSLGLDGVTLMSKSVSRSQQRNGSVAQSYKLLKIIKKNRHVKAEEFGQSICPNSKGCCCATIKKNSNRKNIKFERSKMAHTYPEIDETSQLINFFQQPVII